MLTMSMLMINRLAAHVTDLHTRRVQAELLLDLQRIRHLAERRTAELLAAEGLEVTPAQANVLLALVQHREPMTASQLAKALEVTEVTVGRFVRRLESDGWIQRERDPTDARAILITPTVRARAALPGFIRVSNALADQVLAGIEGERMHALARMTQEIRANLDT